MRKWIIILMLLLLSGVINAQKYDSIYQAIAYKEFNIQPQKIDTFDLLPERIKEIVSDFVSNRFSDYSSKIKFIHAQIFPIDSVFKSDIKDLKEQNATVNPIPYYDLNYSFKDSSLGISQYWINIGMDKLGQVIYCNFPYLEIPRKKINSIQKVKEYSDSIMINLYPQFNKAEYKIDLIYNIDNDILIWQICYLKNAEKNRKDYHCLLINAHYNDLIKQQGMFEEYYPIVIDCCDTRIKIYINNE